MILRLGLTFAAGLVGFLSPCVLPLLPGYVGYMTGAAAGERVAVRKALPGTLAFVAGMTTVFLALFATATAVSQLLIDNRRTLEIGSGTLVILLGSLMVVGAFGPALVDSLETRWPRVARGLAAVLARVPGVLRERRFHMRPRVGVWPSFLLGAAFVFGWTPCIGPTLGAALNLAADAQTVGQGMAYMAAYSAGIGLPFIAAGLGLITFGGRLKRHALTIQAAGGLLMVAVGVLLLTGQLTIISIWMQRLLGDRNLDFWDF